MEVEPGPVFIGGHPGTGTNLMRLALDRHSSIACGPEGDPRQWITFRDFHRYMEEAWAPNRLWKYGFGTSELDAAMAAFIDDFFTRHRLRQGKRRWAEATPENILQIDYLFRLFPNSRFVHMIRDPRDVYCSLLEGTGSVADSPRLAAGQFASRWVNHIEKGLAWRDDVSRYLEVRYEDLVQRPRDVMKNVLAFLGESWEEPVVVARGGGPDAFARISSRAVGGWRQALPADDVRQIESIVGPLMRQAGYETGTTSDSEHALLSGPERGTEA